MSKYVNINSTDDFEKFVKNIDSSKFSTKITEELFKKNNWYFTSYNDGTGKPKFGWMPDLGIMLYDPDDDDFEDPNDDFEDVFVWFKVTKEAWCYQYCYGTYVYNIKSVAELEIILAREGFGYSFDI